MITCQRSFVQLFLVPSAFSATSLLRSANLAFLLSVTRRPHVTRNWATTQHDRNSMTLANKWKNASNVLVCGDGDLSYSAWMADQLACAGVSLTATVLETKDVHNSGESTSGCLRLSIFCLYSHLHSMLYSVQEFSAKCRENLVVSKPQGLLWH